MKICLCNSPLKVRVKELSVAEAQQSEVGTKLAACIKNSYFIGTVCSGYRNKELSIQYIDNMKISLNGKPEPYTKLYRIVG